MIYGLKRDETVMILLDAYQCTRAYIWNLAANHNRFNVYFRNQHSDFIGCPDFFFPQKTKTTENTQKMIHTARHKCDHYDMSLNCYESNFYYAFNVLRIQVGFFSVTSAKIW